jgi:hypothetical protein
VWDRDPVTENTAGGPHVTKPIHWLATGAIVVGIAACAAAIILGSVLLGVIGGVLAVGAAAAALVSGLMQNVEEYPTPRDDVT